MQFINLTSHDVVLNSGVTIPASGTVARVAANYGDFDADGIAVQSFGQVQDLPDPAPGVTYVVSALVLSASDRTDLVAPATGHPDCVRDDSGRISSVPGFVQSAKAAAQADRRAAADQVVAALNAGTFTAADARRLPWDVANSVFARDDWDPDAVTDGVFDALQDLADAYVGGVQ